MKRHHYMLIGTLFLLLAVCEDKIEDSIGFFRLMERNQKGVIIFQVCNATLPGFTGEMVFSNDEVELRLLNGTRACYAVRIHFSDIFKPSGTFCANPGVRNLERSSFDWVFALVLIVSSLRGSLGFRGVKISRLRE